MSAAAWRRRFRAPRLTLPSWARDEPEHLLYGSNATGKLELYVWDRRADVHRRLTDRPEGTSAGRLAAGGESAWWFDDENGSELGRWVVEPFAGGERMPALPSLPPAYSTGLALGRDAVVAGFSNDSGTEFHVVQGGRRPKRIYHHREYAEVVSLSRDERLLAIEHSEHGDSLHPAVRVTDLSGRPVAGLSDGPARSLHAGAWSPVAGDQRLLITHERRGVPSAGIWQAGHEGYQDLVIDLPGEVDAGWYPDARALLLHHEHGGRSELYRYPLADGTLERLPAEPGTIDGARVRPDGDVWYSWSNASTPPEVRSLEHGLLLRPPGEPAPSGVGYRDLHAGRVHCFLAEPEGARPHPTILLIHGGPSAHDRDAFAPRVQAWVDHGFAVVLVNYRGSDGYGEEWRDALIGNPGLTELQDIAAARDLVVAEGVADPGRLILSGRSWGGYLTLLGLGTRPELWALGIADVPVADYFAAFEDEMEPLKAFDRSLFGGSPDERPDFYRERSPLTYIDRVRVPVYISGGENDPRCPIRQIRNYAAGLEERGRPHRLYLYDAGHASMVVDEQIRQLEAQLTFAAEHLGTRPPL